ncbi:SprT-like domain-containing protein [Pseudoalteromonas prydzensis]|uniref:SprT-like domain-containing protein n=1 Tax=Pseudoalteromonas prydzensis TaxID=182141 RepID=UPI003FD3BBE9
MITIDFIQDKYQKYIKEFSDVIALDNWTHYPLNKVELSSKATYLGEAFTSGLVELNERFIGTDCYSLLDNTIKHELCHLMVGIANGHNNKFKRAANRFDVQKNELFNDLSKIISKTKYKYEVYVKLVNGSRAFIGGAHRKSKKYTQYNVSDEKNLSYKSVTIDTFEFIET